ncbi:hypothetical protein M407DRAFT_27433 [Tulasnella calospora MUT 4182]|uniref:Uncharacterized protein n=1 Tax=Tulasnella calospora MUT 4182 TaxID=1051891 RepID=A0A0C3Q380_9AGAM|nr:hypothetical protein M407DRAFT_27433 [Tulasnella calospora MUT 4182]
MAQLWGREARRMEQPGIWASIDLFIAGWIGNIVHDEVLLNIRKESKKKRLVGKMASRSTGFLTGTSTASFGEFLNYFCE